MNQKRTWDQHPSEARRLVWGKQGTPICLADLTVSVVPSKVDGTFFFILGFDSLVNR